MTVQELNTLLSICETEKNQLLTILTMSVENSQIAGFLLTGNCSFFLLYTKLIDALTVYL